MDAADFACVFRHRRYGFYPFANDGAGPHGGSAPGNKPITRRASRRKPDVRDVTRRAYASTLAGDSGKGLSCHGRRTASPWRRLKRGEVPADLAYALSLTGLPANAVTRSRRNWSWRILRLRHIQQHHRPRSECDGFVPADSSRGIGSPSSPNPAATGDLIWAETFPARPTNRPGGFAFDGMGNVYVAGTFTGAVDFDPSPTASAVYTAATGVRRLSGNSIRMAAS